MVAGHNREGGDGGTSGDLALRLFPAAVRAVGDDILVARPGPDLPVHRLTGSSPTLWRLFEAGATVDEAASCVADATHTPVSSVRPGVAAFARRLVTLGLAEPA